MILRLILTHLCIFVLLGCERVFIVKREDPFIRVVVAEISEGCPDGTAAALGVLEAWYVDDKNRIGGTICG